MQLYTLTLLIFVLISITSANLVESREDSFVTKNRKAEERVNQFIPFQEFTYNEEYYDDPPQMQTRSPTPAIDGGDIIYSIPPSAPTDDVAASESSTSGSVATSPSASPTVDPVTSTLKPSSTSQSAQEYTDTTSMTTSMPRPSSQPTMVKSSMSPSTMPSSVPSLKKSDQSLSSLRGSLSSSNDHDKGINGKTVGDTNDKDYEDGSNDAKKSSPFSSITIIFISVGGGLVAIIVVGGLIVLNKFKKERGRPKFEDDAIYPYLPDFHDSESSSDYGFDNEFDESYEDIQFNIVMTN